MFSFCGNPVTVGVLNRVMELADRKEPVYPRCAGMADISDTPEAPGANRTAEAAFADRAGAGPAGSGLPAGSDESFEPPLGERRFASLAPLPELLSEILDAGPKTRRVTDMYGKLLSRFGSELHILQDADTDGLSRFFPPLGEAVARMRRGDVFLQGGYDGEYGTIRVFSDHELREIRRGAGVSKSKDRAPVQGLPLMGDALPLPRTKTRKKPSLPEQGDALSAQPEPTSPAESYSDASTERSGTDTAAKRHSADARTERRDAREPDEENSLNPPVEQAGAHLSGAGEAGQAAATFSPAPPVSEDILNPSQETAVTAGPGPVLVSAGPGTGKTRTLIARIKYLVEQGVHPRKIVALTFTRRAATEMDARLKEAFAPGLPLPRTDTLHALALELWHRTHETVPVLLSEDSARRVFIEANSDLPAQTLREAGQAVELARERLVDPPEEYAQTAQQYIAQKNAWNLADYTDLPEFWLARIRNELYSSPWTHVLVDEVQDLSLLQLTLIRSLLPASGEGFFGIGDPDQSIYGFRGAHGQSTAFFREAWPHLQVISLTHNYRSRPGILQAAVSALTRAISSALEATRPSRRASRRTS